MKAYWALDETDVRLNKTNRKIAKTKKQLASATRQLNFRANNIYRRENLDLVGFLVGAQSFEEFASRMDYLSRIGTADARAVAEVKRLRRSLFTEKKRLVAERKVRSKEAARLKRQRNALQKRLASTEAEFRKVQRQLDASRSGGSLPAGIAGAAGPNGMVFPVRGSNYYSNTWGASRSGGRRRHQGTDIMARRGTPVVACVSGTVRVGSNGLGGRTIWLRGKNGWSYYYAHLDRFVVRSGSVRAGQVIGTVGSTGNAAASSPHLHFQMHRGGGAPTNPYPYLRRME
jgi:murein DD-endopeptidase MepM/ murein hydrolase activator NlpD